MIDALRTIAGKHNSLIHAVGMTAGKLNSLIHAVWVTGEQRARMNHAVCIADEKDVRWIHAIGIIAGKRERTPLFIRIVRSDLCNRPSTYSTLDLRSRSLALSSFASRVGQALNHHPWKSLINPTEAPLAQDELDWSKRLENVFKDVKCFFDI